MLLAVPPSFDPVYYRATNGDLEGFSDAAAANHYNAYGKAEGRASSPFAFREKFLPLIAGQGRILEIGPFTNPSLRGSGVKYFDVLNRAALIARATAHGYPVENAPEIDFVSPDGDLSIVAEPFDAIFSSHVIEHQPDLVEHLLQVQRILKPGGSYFLIVPDKRYCFDHFLPESGLGDVLGAHYEGRKLHGLKSIVEHRACLTHNDAAGHWSGEHGALAHVADKAAAAVSEWQGSAGTYIDVHAWQFTPDSFAGLLASLLSMRLTTLTLQRVFQTPAPRQEFCAILRRPQA